MSSRATTPVTPQPVPRWVQIVTVVAVSVVAAVAAVASYVHMHELATDAGEEWRAHLIPLSVDGMLVAASMVMLVRRRIGQSAGVLPWVGLVLGLVASLAANVAAADPTPLSWIVSGWPPLALAVSFELLILVTRDVEQAAQVPAAEAAHAPRVDAEPDPVARPKPAADDLTAVRRAKAAEKKRAQRARAKAAANA